MSIGSDQDESVVLELPLVGGREPGEGKDRVEGTEVTVPVDGHGRFRDAFPGDCRQARTIHGGEIRRVLAQERNAMSGGVPGGLPPAVRVGACAGALEISRRGAGAFPQAERRQRRHKQPTADACAGPFAHLPSFTTERRRRQTG